MEFYGHFSLTILLVLVGVQSLARFVLCRPTQKMTKHIFVQRDLIIEDIKKGKLNVSQKRKMRLFSPKSKAYLQVMDNAVNAKGATDSKYADLVIESVGFGLIRIRGEISNSYICFNPRTSKLIAKKNGADKDCIFTETIGKKTKRTIFTSLEHKTWHIGIKNNGKPRLGARPNKTTTANNNTYEFTPMRGRTRRP